MSVIKIVASVIVGFFFLSGCTSMQKRQEERNKVAQSSGLYCEFVNGDANNDVDVEVNLRMSKKCDINKQFTITNYKNASDLFGVIFCCHYQKGSNSSSSSSTASPSLTPKGPGTGAGTTSPPAQGGDELN